MSPGAMEGIFSRYKAGNNRRWDPLCLPGEYLLGRRKFLEWWEKNRAVIEWDRKEQGAQEEESGVCNIPMMLQCWGGTAGGNDSCHGRIHLAKVPRNQKHWEKTAWTQVGASCYQGSEGTPLILLLPETLRVHSVEHRKFPGKSGSLLEFLVPPIKDLRMDSGGNSMLFY